MHEDISVRQLSSLALTKLMASKIHEIEVQDELLENPVSKFCCPRANESVNKNYCEFCGMPKKRRLNEAIFNARWYGIPITKKMPTNAGYWPAF